uniref:Uncharacterized protein n=1 Tax=Megaselia scalaris TaxID=36166 RepID=T1GPR0_MEGSC
MEKLGYNVKNIVPQFSKQLWEQPSLWGRALESPLSLNLKKPINNSPTMAVESGFLAHLGLRRLSNFEDLSAPPKSALKFDVMNPKPTKIGSDTEPPFGKGIVVSRTSEGQAIVSSVPAANAIYRDVYTSVFNRSQLLPFTFVVHNAQQDSFFFIKEELWRASEDRQQLKRLQGQVNTTYHEIERENGSGSSYLDVKIHGQHAIINLRYGTTVEKEKQRLMHHAKLTAVRKAWHREKEILRNGLTSGIEWTQQEIDEILKQGYANNYEGDPDENGEFHIPYPPSSEIYVFNRYGQHVATKDLTSGKTRYSFLYSKNTSFGRLSTVTDSSGNKIQFLRDYSNVVSSIENTQDRKSEISINGIGIMTKLAEKGKYAIELDYDSNTGLLMSRSSGGETCIYQYDEFGRVTGMILPSGETVRITSQLADNKGLSVYVHASIESLFSQERKRQENAAAEIKPNNTLVIHDSNGVVVESSAIARHPLLEAALPVEAEMLPMWSHQSITMGDGLVNNMYSVYNLVGDVRNPQQTLNREIW